MNIGVLTDMAAVVKQSVFLTVRPDSFDVKLVNMLISEIAQVHHRAVYNYLTNNN